MRVKTLSNVFWNLPISFSFENCLFISLCILWVICSYYIWCLEFFIHSCYWPQIHNWQNSVGCLFICRLLCCAEAALKPETVSLGLCSFLSYCCPFYTVLPWLHLEVFSPVFFWHFQTFRSYIKVFLSSSLSWLIYRVGDIDICLLLN